MGKIKRQSILSTIYTYAGVVLGFVTTALLFSKFLTPSENGLLKLLVSYSTIFAQFATLGFNGAVIKFFPFFRSEDKKNHGLMFLLLVVTLVGFMLFLVLFFSISPLLVESNKEDSPLFSQYLYLIVPLTLFTLLFNVFDAFYRGLFKSTVGTFLREFAQRTFIFTSIILYIFEFINLELFIIFYCISLSLPAIIMLILLVKDGQFNLKPDLNYLEKSMANKMIHVSVFGLITGFGNIAILNIDSIMINEFNNTALTGIYAITSYFGVLVSIPSRSFLRIGGSVIAQAFKDNNISIIKDIYKRSCLNQFIIGLLLLLGLVANIDNVFQILPPEYLEGKNVIIFIGVSHLLIMAGGANTIIIANSEFYKLNALAVMVLLVLTIVTNWIFIPIYGITGAAFASALSMLLFNLLKFIVIYVNLKLQPYNYKFLIAAVMALVTFGIVHVIPKSANLYLNIIWVSGLTVILFVTPVLLLRISTDINQMFEKALSIIKKSD